MVLATFNDVHNTIIAILTFAAFYDIDASPNEEPGVTFIMSTESGERVDHSVLDQSEVKILTMNRMIVFSKFTPTPKFYKLLGIRSRYEEDKCLILTLNEEEWSRLMQFAPQTILADSLVNDAKERFKILWWNGYRIVQGDQIAKVEENYCKINCEAVFLAAVPANSFKLLARRDALLSVCFDAFTTHQEREERTIHTEDILSVEMYGVAGESVIAIQLSESWFDDNGVHLSQISQHCGSFTTKLRSLVLRDIESRRIQRVLRVLDAFVHPVRFRIAAFIDASSDYGLCFNKELMLCSAVDVSHTERGFTRVLQCSFPSGDYNFLHLSATDETQAERSILKSSTTSEGGIIKYEQHYLEGTWKPFNYGYATTLAVDPPIFGIKNERLVNTENGTLRKMLETRERNLEKQQEARNRSETESTRSAATRSTERDQGGCSRRTNSKRVHLAHD